MPVRFRLISAVSILLCSLAQSLTGTGMDWPRWRGPDHTGVSMETGWSAHWPAQGPKVLWKVSVGTGFSSIAIAQGRAYTMGHRSENDVVWCFDSVTGREKWKHSYPEKLDARLYEGGPNATPTVEGGMVFTLSRYGEAFCLNAEDGKVIWRKNLMKEFGLEEPGQDWWGFTGSPLVEGNLVIYAAGTHGVALDKKTGKAAWSTGKGPNGYASPVVATLGGKRAVALLSAKALGVVDPASGSTLWELPWKTAYDVNAADPIFANGHVFLSSGYRSGGALFKLGAGEPEQVWKSQEMHNQMNPSVLVAGHLYGISGQERRSGDVRCVEFLTGTLKWKDTSAGMGSLIAADGKLIILSERGELIIAEANPESFKPLARAQVLGGRCWTAPALSHGLIYCRNARGDLVCLDSRGGKD